MNLDRQARLELEIGGWKAPDQFVVDYLKAVGDELPTYFQYRLVPPVALAARALGILLEKLELPPGTIHSLQEIAIIKPVHFEEEITGTAMVGPAKRRGGMEFITVGFTLNDREGRDILRGKTTVLVADESYGLTLVREESSDADRDRHSGSTHVENVGEVKIWTLPNVLRTITQDRLDAYASVSGDWNPLHLDAGFAATSIFGGIISHGMLTLAFISEMMAGVFEKAWLETAGLKVRFKGAAYLGDRVETRGKVLREDSVPDGRRLICAVAAYNPDRQQELISGTATVILD